MTYVKKGAKLRLPHANTGFTIQWKRLASLKEKVQEFAMFMEDQNTHRMKNAESFLKIMKNDRIKEALFVIKLFIYLLCFNAVNS